MSRDLFSRYVWLVETIRRHGRISRAELDEQWRRSDFSEGNPLPRRTFFNYRAAIEETFNINIEYDKSTNSYYITDTDDSERRITDWLLNSAAVNNVLSDSRDMASLIMLEDVPSARLYLPDIIEALRSRHPLRLSYHSYTRLRPTDDIRFEPYFLKLFRQRWYVIGRNVGQDSIKTYALDRITKLSVDTETYTIPEDFDVKDFSADSFGIVFNHSLPKKIVLRVDSNQAKYFRALPLHASQTEEISDGGSTFTYKMKISEDFVRELMSYGPNITVVEPPELRAMITDRLTKALDNYKSPEKK